MISCFPKKMSCFNLDYSMLAQACIGRYGSDVAVLMMLVVALLRWGKAHHLVCIHAIRLSV
jgi:hypothetical protein